MTIKVIENTVKINSTMKADMHALEADMNYWQRQWRDYWQITNDNNTLKLVSEDPFEDTRYLAPLQNNGARGRITFVDYQEGKEPKYWGYYFDGYGTVQVMKGNLNIVWSVKEIVHRPSPLMTRDVQSHFIGSVLYNTKGDSYKFWRVETKGKDVVRTYGRIGTEGQETHKKFPTVVEAISAARKMHEEKLREGYRKYI